MSRNTLLLGAAENGGYFNNVREGGKVNARLCSIFIGEKKLRWVNILKTQINFQRAFFFLSFSWSWFNKRWIICMFLVLLLNNYWMRLSMISWIIKTEVWVICRSRRLRQITQTRDFDNSWYHAKTEFNNCFIIHFSHNSSSETQEKRSAILFLRRALQGA